MLKLIFLGFLITWYLTYQCGRGAAKSEIWWKLASNSCIYVLCHMWITWKWILITHDFCSFLGSSLMLCRKVFTIRLLHTWRRRFCGFVLTWGELFWYYYENQGEVSDIIYIWAQTTFRIGRLRILESPIPLRRELPQWFPYEVALWVVLLHFTYEGNFENLP